MLVVGIWEHLGALSRLTQFVKMRFPFVINSLYHHAPNGMAIVAREVNSRTLAKQAESGTKK